MKQKVTNFQNAGLCELEVLDMGHNVKITQIKYDYKGRKQDLDFLVIDKFTLNSINKTVQEVRKR